MKRSHLLILAAAQSLLAAAAPGHEHTLHQFLTRTRAAKDNERRDDSGGAPHCHLTIDLVDADNGKPLPGLIHVVDLGSGKALSLGELIKRENDWYAMPSHANLALPRSKVRVTAFHGLTTTAKTRIIDLRKLNQARIKLRLTKFYDPHEKGLRSGNTHLHLMNLTHQEAHRYLTVVPAADGLDLVYLSHLRRIPDERNYISNQIVLESFAGGSLRRLSEGSVLFANGEEHRHNFGRGGEGYGHVMLLDLVKLIKPVSIGPGIMRSGHDGIPLRRGIDEAHRDGAAVIWCHNTFGFEDIPSWIAGVLDAQNIFDGGTHGTYEDTFYKYLNLGLEVPFSTGTDWFIYDFSRVYVPIEGELTSKKWLAQLARGRTFITNGTFLEFRVEDRQAGDTIELARPSTLTVTARGIGRNDFKAIELVHNGQVIHSTACENDGSYFAADMSLDVDIDQPGWLALRIALDAGQNEFGRELFAHTSPVYLVVGGKRIFRPQVARQLLKEINGGIQVIERKGEFVDQADRDAVLNVHQEGIKSLRQRLKQH